MAIGDIQELNEPFFVFKDRSAVTPEHARSLLKDILSKLNLDTQLYNCHSFRIGKCSDMQKIGYSLAEIKQKGCWLSNAVYKYLRN